MATWSVTLLGDPADLRALVALGVGVTEEGDCFVFRSPELDALTVPREVDQRATEWVEVFNGMSRIEEAIQGRISRSAVLSVTTVQEGRVRYLGSTSTVAIQRPRTSQFPGVGHLATRETRLGEHCAPSRLGHEFSLWNVYGDPRGCRVKKAW
jgi:hypothetical protein